MAGGQCVIIEIDARIRTQLQDIGTENPFDRLPYFYRVEIGETNLVDSSGNRPALREHDAYRNGLAVKFFESDSLTYTYETEQDGRVILTVTGRLGVQFDDEEDDASDVFFEEDLAHITFAFAEDGSSPAREVDGTLMESSCIVSWEVVDEHDDWWQG